MFHRVIKKHLLVTLLNNSKLRIATVFTLLRVFRALGNSKVRVRACGGISMLFAFTGLFFFMGMAVLSFVRALTVLVAAGGGAVAQPSPEVQRRITAAIEAAGNAPTIDYTAFVNPFIGTGTYPQVTYFRLSLYYT